MVAVMSPLKNFRHEAFAVNLALATKHGWSNGECYARSGYKAVNDVAEAAASRLLGNVKHGVSQRVQELMNNGARKASVSVASLLDELEQARAAAQDDKQFSAAVQAIAGKARLTGLDNREKGGGGSASEYDKLETVEQVIAALVAECGGSPAQALAEFDELRGMIEDYAASHAVVISAEPARPRPDEARLPLQYLQPKRRRR